MNAEDAFLKEIKRAFVISIGSKRQGKTYLLCKVLNYCILNKVFDEYHLILPEFETERDGKYDFLKNMKNVTIYDRYDASVSEIMLEKYKKKHIFFGIDDASGEFTQNIDPMFKKLCTRNEHGKFCAIWINVHSSKKVLAPIIRQQITNIFIYKMSNYNLLKSIYEEYFQMIMPRFDEFHEMYNAIVFNQENNAIMYALDGNNEFNGIKTWNLLNETIDEEPKKPAKRNIKHVEQTSENIEEITEIPQNQPKTVKKHMLFNIRKM